MYKLIIDRSTWMRGGKPVKTWADEEELDDDGEPITGECDRDGCLVDSDSYRCCLGFYALDNGVSECSALDVPLPSDRLPAEEGEEHEWLTRKSCSYLPNIHCMVKTNEEVLADINDATNIDEATREAWLIEGFKALANIEVEFVGSQLF